MTAEPPYQNQYGQNPYEAAPPPLPELAIWWERLLARLIDGIIVGVVVRIIITPIITGSVPRGLGSSGCWSRPSWDS